MIRTLKSLVRRLMSRSVSNPVAARRARHRLGLELLDDRTLPSVTWGDVRTVLNTGQALMQNTHVRQLVEQAGSALQADLPVVNQSPAGAAGVVGKLQEVFAEAQAGVADTLEDARAALTAAGFTVERLELTPETGTNDLVRLRYSPTPQTFSTKLTAGSTLGLGSYFDRAYGDLTLGSTSASVTLGMDVVYGIDLVAGVPTFYVSDQTGVRVTDLKLAAPLKADLTIGSLADVSAAGALSIDVDAALEIADRPGGKVRLADLPAAATGTLGGSVSLSGVEFTATVPVLDSIHWTGNFSLNLATGSFGGGVSLPSAEQAVGWIAGAAQKFMAGVGEIPLLDKVRGILDLDVGSLGGIGDLNLGSLGSNIHLGTDLGWLLSPNWVQPGGSGVDLLAGVNLKLQSLGVTLLPAYATGGVTLAEAADAVGKLIAGKPVDLIRFETSGGNEWSKTYSETLAQAAFTVGPIPVTASVSAFVEPHVAWSYQVGLGVDTTGMYLTPNTGVRVSGGVRVGAEAEVKAAFVLGVGARVGADLSVYAGVGFNDPNPTDGRIYLDELFGSAAPADSGFFDVIRFNAGAEVSGFADLRLLTPWPLPDVTLFDATFAAQTVVKPNDESHTLKEEIRKRGLVLEASYTPVVQVIDGQRVLVLEGTEYADGFRLSGTGGTVRVTKLGVGEGTAAGVDRVEFRGHGGADQLLVDPSFDRPIWADGGDGNDVIEGGAAVDDLRGGDGFDRLFGGGGDDKLDGGDKADELDGGDGNDKLTGGGGGDTLDGGIGNDDLDGGIGNDVLMGGDGNDKLTGGDGQDELRGGSGDDELDGGGNDTVTVTVQNGTATGTVTRLLGDVLDGGEGIDSLDGGEGNDSLNGGSGDDILHGGNGNDVLQGGDGVDELYGEVGDDQLIGESGDDILDGGIGNDELSGGDGDDVGHGGTGNDVLRGGGGYDQLFGEDGEDRFELDFLSDADGVRDYLDGGNHRDFLAVVPPVSDLDVAGAKGQSGNDHIILTQQPGTTQFTAVWRDLAAPTVGRTITFDLQPETADVVVVNGLAGDDLLEIDRAVTAPVQVEGGAGNDTLRGGSGNDTLVGGAGNDVLEGRDGRDILQGGDDYDTLDGGADADAVYGDGGDDIVRGGTGRDILSGGAGNDRLEAADDLIGDLMYGDTGNDTLIGGRGIDVMDGGDNDDILDGGDLTDYLRGGAGNDTLLGGAGRDMLFGGDGNDILDAGRDPAPGVADWKAADRILDEEEDYLRDETIAKLEQELARTDLSNDQRNQLMSQRQEAGDMRAAILLTRAGLDPYQSVFVDILDGEAGNDTLKGSDWNDVITGGTGSDRVVHTTGQDSVYGGSGGENEKDVYVMQGTKENDTIWLAYDPVLGKLSAQIRSPGDVNSAEVVVGGIEFEAVEVDGGDGDDTMTLATLGESVPVGTVQLVGGAGNDRIDASTYTGDTLLQGGDGYDTLIGGHAHNTLEGGADNDCLIGGANNDILDGGDDDDVVDGGAGNDTLISREGDGADILNGGADDDTFNGSGAAFLADTVRGGDGIDTVANVNGSAPLVLSAFDFTWEVEKVSGAGQAVTGTAGNDRLDFSSVVFDAVAFVDGRAGDDIVRGTAGADVLRGGDGVDDIDGGSGDDTIFGDAGNDTLRGGAGADWLYGGNDTDLIQGGDGNDQLFGGAGNDQLLGENGDDVLDADRTVNRMADVELTGNDTLNGGAGNDVLYGRDGADTLIGEAGRDTLYGGGGNDSLHGDFKANDAGAGADADKIYGDDGNDTIYGGGGNDTIDTGAGDNTVHGGDGNDSITGQAGRDSLYGGNGNDTIHGGAGNDQIDGQLGADWLYGGDGDDTIVAGGNSDGVRDYLFGEEGVDTLYYFRDQDIIEGGASIDRYVMIWWDSGVQKSQTWYDGYYRIYDGTYTASSLFLPFGSMAIYS